MSTSEYPARRWRVRRPVALAGVGALSAQAWVLAALVVLAAVIRIITLDNQSLWTDEALTAYEAGLPFGAMLHTVASVETTPPFYFVLIWGWAKVFGTGAVALRSVSAIAGIALVPIAYASARELVSHRAGVVAAALVVVNPYMIWFSQEARAYMLLAALSGASFWFFARARRDPSRRNLGWWAAFSAAAVMTHFFAGFLVAPEALWLLWRHRARATAIAVGVVAGVQAAMLPFALADGSHGAGWIGGIPRANRVAQTVTQWALSNVYRRTSTSEGLALGAALLLVVALLLVLGSDQRARRGAGVAAAIAAIVFAAPLALGLLGQDYFLARNELPAFVPVVTVLSAACVAPRARTAGAVLALILLAVFAVAAIDVQTHPRLQRPDWRNAARALGPALVPRAILAADGLTADPLKVYLPGVDWTQPHTRSVVISELDVVGATKRIRLLPTPEPPRSPQTGRAQNQRNMGSALPRSLAPPGSRLIARLKVNNWVIARYALDRPERVSINTLNTIAPRYFRRTPAALLIFIQPRAR